MTYSVPATTAEHVIAATDAALANPDGADITFVSSFTGMSNDAARRALDVAQQLALVADMNGVYSGHDWIARYLICADQAQGAAVMRVVLGRYEPFGFFCNRLALGESPSTAADRTKTRFAIAEHRDEVRDTLLSLGTFAKALQSEGAGVYKVPDRSAAQTAYIIELSRIGDTIDQARYFLTNRLGASAHYAVQAQAQDELAMAAHLLVTSADARAPIVHAANGIESVLVRIAQDRNVNIANATGINQKAERLRQANVINEKHRAMLSYLGHIRNAADHGVDPSINAQWQIQQSTTIEYINVAMSAVRALCAHVYQTEPTCV